VNDGEVVLKKTLGRVIGIEQLRDEYEK